MGADQVFDALRRMVEALREPRHLVAAFDRHSRGEIAGTQCFDARLQPLQPPGQAAHKGIST